MPSVLNITVVGIPDGNHMTVLDTSDGTRVTRENLAYLDSVLTLTLADIDPSTRIKGYVDDSENPSTAGAYLEGLTTVLLVPLFGNTFAQLGDVIITGDSVLYNYTDEPTGDLLLADGSLYDPLTYPQLHNYLSATSTPWTALTDSIDKWIDNSSGLETEPLNDGQSAILVLNVPFDTVAGVRVSSEEGFDWFTVDDFSGATIWGESGEESAEIILLASGSPYTFKYSKDGASFEGEDKAWVDYITDIYPTVDAPLLPNHTTETESPFPYKIVADYTGA